MDEPPGDRPRWLINWGFKFERVGRSRREHDADDLYAAKERMRIRWGYVLISIVFVIEVMIGVWLGVLPR